MSIIDKITMTAVGLPVLGLALFSLTPLKEGGFCLVMFGGVAAYINVMTVCHHDYKQELN